ncbi:PREDICTED: pyridine nucleotide-disulfide oxidoreductase domain-containing protein 2-like isoform X2 [Priapulus caudatus]|uniref:Pyridine nucleotide-disulfide oxidoreductase domain-containing protein 2-like isoform X2 n=1 Tax=Priapulus caudatus TaxID=37621 RepID=A0ABM1ELT2_PRICU|nr:PREDICTED: pyridine nucleotide-disulfide oxidoreductase domain-containing protein 2-like isoform X2 [Priapulus caudatus]
MNTCKRVAVGLKRNSLRDYFGTSTCYARTQLCHTYVLPDSELKSSYDAVIVGGGGLSCESWEKGFQFSRASYVLSLLRPHIMQDLELVKHGLKLHLRDPCSYTPILESEVSRGCPQSLLMGPQAGLTVQEIGKFSKKDAEAFPLYEQQLERFAQAIQPLLDNTPIDSKKLAKSSLWEQIKEAYHSKHIFEAGKILGEDLPLFYEYLTAPASKILNQWFDSEPLKATLATDSVIGAMISPDTPGSSYVLLHHVMGELEKQKGIWAYPEGGMGAVSSAIASSARAAGVEIFTNKAVSQFIVDASNGVRGVALNDGTEVRATAVLSNATAKVTFLDLCPAEALPSKFRSAIGRIDYTSPVTKINVATRGLPNFVADPSVGDDPMPHHRATIHLNCEHMSLIQEAYEDASRGEISRRPLIEMTIPSSMDRTIAPEGCHVLLFFTQFTPYTLAGGKTWDEKTKQAYAEQIFGDVEKYAPGFRELIVGYEVLPPPELEKIFGLTEYLPRRHVAGSAVFHKAGAWRIWKPVTCEGTLPVWEWCTPRWRSDGSARLPRCTSCAAGWQLGAPSIAKFRKERTRGNDGMGLSHIPIPICVCPCFFPIYFTWCPL